MLVKVNVEIPSGELCNVDADKPCRFLKTEDKLGTYGFGNTRYAQKFGCTLYQEKLRRAAECRIAKCKQCLNDCRTARMAQNGAGGLSDGKQ